MTKNEKKELLLLIIENWFDDKSEEINHENCIGFYNFLLDCLEFENKFSPEYEPGYHKFISLITDILSDFPGYREHFIESKNGIKNIVLKFSDNKNHEIFNTFFNILTHLFKAAKIEFLV